MYFTLTSRCPIHPAAFVMLFFATFFGTFFAVPAVQATPITVIASFDVTNGQQPMCGVTFDAAGNMYGTTYRGDSTTWIHQPKRRCLGDPAWDDHYY